MVGGSGPGLPILDESLMMGLYRSIAGLRLRRMLDDVSDEEQGEDEDEDEVISSMLTRDIDADASTACCCAWNISISICPSIFCFLIHSV